jgi:hypothetical protein
MRLSLWLRPKRVNSHKRRRWSQTIMDKAPVSIPEPRNSTSTGSASPSTMRLIVCGYAAVGREPELATTGWLLQLVDARRPASRTTIEAFLAGAAICRGRCMILSHSRQHQPARILLGAHNSAAIRHSIAAVKRNPSFSSCRALRRKRTASRGPVILDNDQPWNGFLIDVLLQSAS